MTALTHQGVKQPFVGNLDVGAAKSLARQTVLVRSLAASQVRV